MSLNLCVEGELSLLIVVKNDGCLSNTKDLQVSVSGVVV